METEEFNRAKELFISCQGSVVQMHRAGIYEEYKQYNISKELEAEWLTEMVNQLAAELSIMDWKAVTQLELIARHHLKPIILEHITTFVTRHLKSADSIVRLMYAEKLIDLIKLFEKAMSKEVLTQTYRIIVDQLNDLIVKPLVVDPGHELHQFELKDKKSLNNRARKNIEALQSYFRN